MDWKEKLRSAFRGGHKNIYDAVKEYADERGVAVTDVVSSAVSSYLAADNEGKEILEKSMADMRANKGSGQSDVKAAVVMFTQMAGGMTELFKAVNELRTSVSIGSIVSDFETITAATEKIRGLGAEKGTGSIEDTLADAFVRGLVNKMTGGDVVLGVKKTKTGEAPVKKIEE